MARNDWLHVRLSAEQREKLEDEATIYGVSVSELVRYRLFQNKKDEKEKK